MSVAEDNDTQWTEGLAGRARGDVPSAREGQVLREAVLGHEARTPVEEPRAQDAARERQLIARAREQGLC